MAPVDYQAVAKKIAGLGTGNDTELVHMTKSEIGAFARMMGRNPKINPNTGLRAFDDSGGNDSSSSDPGDPSETGNSDMSGFSDSYGMGPEVDPNDPENNQGHYNTAEATRADMQANWGYAQTTPDIDLFAPELGTIPATGFLGTVANFVGNPFGVTFGQDRFGNNQVDVDMNVAGMLGSFFGGPAVGYVTSTIADLVGAPTHAHAIANAQDGFNVGFQSPNAANQTTAASVIGEITSKGAEPGSSPDPTTAKDGGVDQPVESKNIAAKEVKKTADSAVIADFIRSTAIGSAVAPTNNFLTPHGRLQPISLLQLMRQA